MFSAVEILQLSQFIFNNWLVRVNSQIEEFVHVLSAHILLWTVECELVVALNLLIIVESLRDQIVIVLSELAFTFLWCENPVHVYLVSVSISWNLESNWLCNLLTSCGIDVFVNNNHISLGIIRAHIVI